MARAISNSKQIHNIWVHVAAAIAVAAWGLSFINTKVLLDNGFTPVQV